MELLYLFITMSSLFVVSELFPVFVKLWWYISFISAHVVEKIINLADTKKKFCIKC